MRVSRTIVYAIHAVLHLSKAGTGMKISRMHLAAAAHLPERFLLEVLHSLVARGIVRSTRGVDGGFALARSADEITLNDIFEAFDFPLAAYVPTVSDQPTAVDKRILEALTRANEAARGELRQLRVSDLLECWRGEESTQANGRTDTYTSEMADLEPRLAEDAFVSENGTGGVHVIVDGGRPALVAAAELSSAARTISKRTEASNGF
jgi:Rrf2 family protein